jgi:hypothetical protein
MSNLCIFSFYVAYFPLTIAKGHDPMAFWGFGCSWMTGETLGAISFLDYMMIVLANVIYFPK